MRSSLHDILQTSAAALAILTALGAVAAWLTEQFPWLNTPLENSLYLSLFLVGIAFLLLMGLVLLRRALARKSRLLRPDALRIDPDDPEHLCGRDGDVRRLYRAVSDLPLVFLEGESGSGKSALVRSGLIKKIQRDAPPTLLPIYIDTYTGDWEEGLAEQMLFALWRALGDSLRKRLGIETRADLRARLSPDGDRESIFYRIGNEFGLIPLLIFDQFDDYQVTHRDHFLRQGRWISADELAAENRQWRDIRAELARRALHCLFVTRRDLFAGLDAARFRESQTRSLDRVAPAHITGLLGRLTAPREEDPVIEHPEAGWEALKERLIQDLSHQGRILPIQARTVFQGLINLPYLATGPYERKGGIEGLEAANIEDAVVASASAAGIDGERVLQALLKLVDGADPNAPKSRMALQETLLETAGLAGHPERGERMLGILEEKGIIRPRIDETRDETKNQRWSLYHDYLARAVLSAHCPGQPNNKSLIGQDV
uniref:AAA ATPase domain n=1 Tax=Candidatus Kentrum sp. UNK TaxID=2126344 RepID=A0A451B3I6_9GAMM|nr:MAG: AAA ATPase domain [Candidatus Kentron sp. UNK]VFK72848.1 MAG: AAA ATPase domain [Candidatus Kentron sp. UNK]